MKTKVIWPLAVEQWDSISAMGVQVVNFCREIVRRCTINFMTSKSISLLLATIPACAAAYAYCARADVNENFDWSLWSDKHQTSESVSGITWSKTTKRLALSYGPRILLFENGTAQEIVSQNGGRIDSLTFAPDGNSIASVSAEGVLDVSNLSTRQSNKINLNNRGSERSSFCSLAFSADGKSIWVVSRNAADLWEISSNKRSEHLMDLHCPAVASASGAYIASESHNIKYGIDDRLLVWEISSLNNGPEVIRDFDANKGDIHSIAVGHSGDIIAAAQNGGEIFVWKKNMSTISWVYCKLFGCFGRFSALAGHRGIVTTLSLSYDESLLISGSLDKTIKIWNIKENKELTSFEDSETSIRSVIALQDKCVAYGTDDGAVFIRSIFNKSVSTKIDLKHVKDGMQIDRQVYVTCFE